MSVSMQQIIKIFQQNNIIVTPGGRWRLDTTTSKKVPIDARRKNYANWSTYPDDNMGKHFITKEQNILIIDIDKEPVDFVELGEDGWEIHIPSLNLTLPKTLATQTSQPGKYHLYYKVDDSSTIANRHTHINGTKVDFFTYGNIFDPHLYSPHFKMLGTTIVKAPDEVVEFVKNVSSDLKLPTTASSIQPYTNITRYNLIRAFLDDKIHTAKDWNAFFRHIFPSKEYKKLKSKNRVTFDKFDFSYTLINDIATKLSATLELGTDEHIRPALKKIIEQYDKNPDYNNILDKQILGTLPYKEAQPPFDIVKDTKTIAEHASNDLYKDLDFLLFKTIHNGSIRYITLNKFSLEPQAHNGDYFLTKDTAQELTPAMVVQVQGKTVWNGDRVPIVYVTNDPFKPQTYYDTIIGRNFVNLYTQTEYVKQSHPQAQVSADNVIMKAFRSVVHPDYLNIVLRFLAETAFGPTVPTTVVWIAALKTDKGGTGKSIVTLEVISKILGVGATGLTQEDLKTGWGDMLTGARLISLEDMESSSKKRFEKVYSTIKQSTSGAKKRLNMKGGKVETKTLNIAITGSSNERLALNPSDRRFLCLEPAHLRGHTEPLTPKEALHLDKIIRDKRDDAYYPEIQEFTNYLLYLSNQPMDDTTYRSLFIEAPETPYRSKWTSIGETNSQNLYLSIKDPERIMDMVNVAKEDEETIAQLLSLIPNTYKPHTGKTAIPWNWFREMLQYIMAEPNPNLKRGEVAKMLDIDITHIGDLYTQEWSRKWRTDGVVIAMTQEEINRYKTVIEKVLKGEYTDE